MPRNTVARNRERLRDLLESDIFTDAPEYAERVAEVQDLAPRVLTKAMDKFDIAFGPGGVTLAPRNEKLVWGHWDARNFSFDAFGHSEAEVRQMMAAQWMRHVKQTGADPDYFNAADDINFYPIGAGVTLREGEEF